MSEGPAIAPASSGWVAVRGIFRSELDGTAMYEEQITLWRTTSMDEAVERAEAEAREYAAALSTPPADPHEYVGLAQAYLLADAPGDGAEVFSLFRHSDLAPEDYLDTFFDTGTERQRDIRDHHDDEAREGSQRPDRGPYVTIQIIGQMQQRPRRPRVVCRLTADNRSPRRPQPTESTELHVGAVGTIGSVSTDDSGQVDSRGPCRLRSSVTYSCSRPDRYSRS